MLVGDDFEEFEGETMDYLYTLKQPAHEMVLAGDGSSLNSLAGQNNPRSLHVWGKYIRKDFLILIDSGARTVLCNWRWSKS